MQKLVAQSFRPYRARNGATAFQAVVQALAAAGREITSANVRRAFSAPGLELLIQLDPEAKDAHGATKAIGDVLGKNRGGLKLQRDPLDKKRFLPPKIWPLIIDGWVVCGPEY